MEDRGNMSQDLVAPSPIGRRRARTQMSLAVTQGPDPTVETRRSKSPLPRHRIHSDLINSDNDSNAALLQQHPSFQRWLRTRPQTVSHRPRRWRCKHWALLGPGVAVVLVWWRILGNFVSINTNVMTDRRILDAPDIGVRYTIPSTTAPIRTNSSGSILLQNARHGASKTLNDLLSKDDARMMLQVTTMQHNRRVERTKRTRPPQRPEPPTGIRIEAHPPRMRYTNTTLQISSDSPPNWKLLCHSAGLTHQSHVLITRALTAPVGPALALLLHQQCGVRITAVDAMIPNLRSVRSNALQVHRLLMRSIRTYRLVVPFVGLSRRTNGLQWLARMNSVTHVIHLESTDAMALQSPLLSPYMSQRSQRSYHLESSLQSLVHVLSYSCNRATSNSSSPMALLHVMEPVPSTKPSGYYTSPWHTRLLKQARELLSATFYELSHGQVALHQLTLPPLLGPNLVTPTFVGPESPKGVPLETAMAAILTALSPRSGLQRMTMVPLTNQSHVSVDAAASKTFVAQRTLQTKAVQLALTYPLGVDKHASSPVRYPHGVHHAMNQVRETYGWHQSRFPCASSCHSPTSVACEPSVFDEIIPVSVAVSSKCQYVVYLVDFYNDTATIFKPGETGGDLCRIAFVAGNSPVVQRAIGKAGTTAYNISREQALQRYNGKLKENGWTLIWLANDDESTLSDAACVVPIMEPSRLFASSVIKAMYTASPSFAEPSDIALLRILERMDRPPLPKHSRREHRSGIVLSRFVPQPAEHGRTVLLFASETPPDYQPETIRAYARLAQAENVTLSRAQIQYYSQLDWIQSNYQRPDDSQQNPYQTSFPFQWISLGLLIHDLRYDSARKLRCSWLDEYLFWGSNRGAEELSLAYILGLQKAEGRMAPGLLDDPTWMPLDEQGQRVPTEGGSDAFVRIMTTKSMV